VNKSKKTNFEKTLSRIVAIEKQLRNIQDFDVLLERVLLESRKLVNADAGSIYIPEGALLRIKYAQNDTQQAKLQPGEKLPFVAFTFPIDDHSIAGYAAHSNKLINIADVYHIDGPYPFSFNEQSDELTGYRTQSMLTIPLAATTGKIYGVLQLINARDTAGNVIPFDDNCELYINHFGSVALSALERAYLTHLMIMRIIEMARFRDPKETGSHVNRVSNYAIEIYDRWAFNHRTPAAESERFRDTLKIAATLHDVGKVGIPDHILKKPGKFTDEEYAVVKSHTCIGAHLFSELANDIDAMSRDVILRHHERWDGKGYPGNIDIDAAMYIGDSIDAHIMMGPGLKNEEIPLSARIVSVADVFDALCSRRVYKAAWTIEDSIAEIQSQRGQQFDPAVVDSFMEILPRIIEIHAAWPDDI
jgi:HD-GYP domain-containing protein (c-di-GMP phosphodiesterase class II)